MPDVKERWITEGATLQEMKEELVQHLEEIRKDFSGTIDYYIRALHRKDGDHPVFIMHSIQEEMHELALMGGLPVHVAMVTLSLAKAEPEAEEVEVL